eukprot:7335591-Pyramimonas_sp.AAC.1
MSGPFMIISSGAVSGGLGCELWINLEAPLSSAKGKHITLRRQDAVALHCGPRRLIVAINSPALTARVA